MICYFTSNDLLLYFQLICYFTSTTSQYVYTCLIICSLVSDHRFSFTMDSIQLSPIVTEHGNYYHKFTHKCSASLADVWAPLIFIIYAYTLIAFHSRDQDHWYFHHQKYLDSWCFPHQALTTNAGKVILLFCYIAQTPLYTTA